MSQAPAKTESAPVDAPAKKSRLPFDQLGNLFRAIVSPDPETRRMGWLFIFSVLGVLLASAMVVKRLTSITETWRQSRRESAMLKQQQEEAIHNQQDAAKNGATTVDLGRFTVALKNSRDLQAEVGIGLVCDVVACKQYLESNQVRVRNEVITQLAAIERDQLMSGDGKRVIKKQLIERLNRFLDEGEEKHPRGQVQELYFSRLFIQQ